MQKHSLPRKLIRRWLGTLLILGVVALVSLSQTTDVMGQGVSTSSFGIGRGQGLETGINLDVLNVVKTDIAAGAYNRQCTAAEHNPNKWHSLVNIEAKCHYDHHHGDDPNYVNDLFGEPGAWFNNAGMSISYPWQTFKAASPNDPNDAAVAAHQMENDLKHEGYMWFVRRDQRCPNGGCITDFRVQIHSIFGPHDATVRFHSFSYEGRMCADASRPETCGMVRHGGWLDFGRLYVTTPDSLFCATTGSTVVRVPIPADNLYFPHTANDELRCHPTIRTVPRGGDSTSPLMQWWGYQDGRLRVQIRSFDPLSNINPQAPDQWNPLCAVTDMTCTMNQSTMNAFVGYRYTLHEFADGCSLGCIPVDPDKNGKTNFTAFTNRMGRLAPECTAVNQNCAPIQYNDVTLNDYGGKVGTYRHSVCDSCPRVDYDLSPAGQRWNTWFYAKYGGGQTQPTPQPTTGATTQPTAGATTQPTVQPTAVPTQAPNGPAVVIDVKPATATPGQTVTLDVYVYEVKNLYGMQVECQVDPAVLTGAARSDGDAFNASNSFFIDNGYQPSGKWAVAASRLQPAAPINGTMKAFSMTYNVLSAGDGKVNCTLLAVDANGKLLNLQLLVGSYSSSGAAQPTVQPTTQPTAVVTAEPTVELTPVGTGEPAPMGTVSGVAAFQNRTDNAGITVSLYSITGGLVSEVTTDAAGAFSFADVVPGEYRLLLRAPQHIPVIAVAIMSAEGTAVDAGSLTLHSGDTDDNGVVDVLDATFIGANFGVDAPPAPGNADLNADLSIDIADLVLVGGNFGAESPLNQGQ